MTTPAQIFTAKLEDPAFRDAFEAAPAEERQKLLDRERLSIPLKEAEAIFADLSDSLSEEELGNVSGGLFTGRPTPPNP